MRENFQEPYLGRFVDEPNMGLIDRREPEWIDFNHNIAKESLIYHREELKLFQKQIIDWLAAGNAGGIFLAASFLSFRFTIPSDLKILVPVFLSFLFGLMAAWLAAFSTAKRAAGMVRFYNKNFAYLQSLKIYQNDEIDVSHYWRQANLAANELEGLMKIPKRWIFASSSGFTLGVVGFLLSIIVRRF